MRNKNNKSAFIGNILILGISLFVALLLSEFMVRVFMPQDLRFNVTQWDEYTGFGHIPGITGFTKHRDYTMYVVINSRGLRDKEYPYRKPEKTIRIGIFGDSFTFGEGVQNNETYPNLMEGMLSEVDSIPVDWNIEVLNFGVGKTGTSHQYALYQKEGYKYDLDIVVLGFLGGNDFNDNIQGVFYIKNGNLVHNPAAYSSVRKIQKIIYKIPFYRWLASNSHLVNFARIIATRRDDRQRGKQFGEQAISEAGKIEQQRENDSLHLTERIMSDFIKRVENDSARFIFMNLPSKGQRLFSEYDSDDEIPEFMRNMHALQLYLENHKASMLDLVAVFEELDSKKYYFENDGHMNPSGHLVVARQLEKFLHEGLVKIAH